MSKTLKTRVVQKHDVESNWLLATNFIPMNGEIIIYDEDDNYNYKRIKIGNGIDNVNDLSFINTNGSSEQPAPTVKSIEPATEDIPKIFIDGQIPTTKTEVNAELTYISKTLNFHAYITIKCQGNSSMSYPKKNFTIKLFKDANRSEKLKVDLKGWGKQNKFVLKANWIDISHLRNVVSARIWGDIVKSRSNYEDLPEELRTSPNQGAVDGFPIKVYNNGVYQGRYT